MIDVGELKKGIAIELDGQPYQVLDYQHIKMGRGSAQIRIKLRDISGGHTSERVFQASEKFRLAPLERHQVQYLYNDGALYYFMDNDTFEQMAIDESKMSKVKGYLKDGTNLEMLTYKELAVDLELPAAVELQVTDTGPGFKGNTASGGTKPAKLETGITVQVPFFINNGDTIKVDTRSCEYLERTG